MPVINKRYAGIPDVIFNGRTGQLVDEHDVDGMAGNMIWAIDNPEAAEKLGE